MASSASILTSDNADGLTLRAEGNWLVASAAELDRHLAGAASTDAVSGVINRQELERQLKVITDDQARLRANLREMPPTAAAYKRYLEKFDAQETQIEQYQADIKKLQGTEHNQQKEFEDYLANFSAE